MIFKLPPQFQTRLSAENLHLIVVALFGWLEREQQMSSNPATTLVPLPLHPAAHTPDELSEFDYPITPPP
jgi:hypothetical protein